MEDEKVIMCSAEEMGIGTAPLKKYGYSVIGAPCIL